MPATPEQVKKFIGNLRTTRGKFAGKPFVIHPFQSDIIDTIFELDDTGNRVRREVVIGVGRKNGKSQLLAAIALALLVVDREPGGLVVIAAAKRDQAALLLDACKRMVQTSSINGAPLSRFIEVRRNHLYFSALDATLRVISSDAQREMGLDPHAVIVDEGHATMQRSREFYDALTSAQGARENPITIVITTAGPVPAGPMYELYEYGCQVRDGQRHDPRFGFIWYAAEPDAAVDDPKAWKDANPALGLFLNEKFLVDESTSVLAGKTPEFSMRRLNLNQWTTAAERWLPYRKVIACQALPNIPEGADVWISIDAAIRRDTMAVACVWVEESQRELDDGTWTTHKIAHALVKHFVPSEDNGYIDPEEVEVYILGLCAKYNPLRISYDPAYMAMLAQSLAERGLPLEAFPQSAMRMERATETFQRVILDERARYGDNPELLKQISSVTTKPTERGHRISKVKSIMKIDMAVALAMALDDALGEEEIQHQDFAMLL